MLCEQPLMWYEQGKRYTCDQGETTHARCESRVREGKTLKPLLEIDYEQTSGGKYESLLCSSWQSSLRSFRNHHVACYGIVTVRAERLRGYTRGLLVPSLHVLLHVPSCVPSLHVPSCLIYRGKGNVGIAACQYRQHGISRGMVSEAGRSRENSLMTKSYQATLM
jgi:hypothetical protein